MIYLIDTIGKETGMHIYDQAFKNSLEEKGLQTIILSNYDEDGQKKLFPNFYHGGRLLMMINFAWALLKMLSFRLSHNKSDDVYVYQSFGLRKIDQLFILMLLGWRKLFVIAHDIFEITGAQEEDKNKAAKLQFYNRHVPAIICQNQDTEEQLKVLGYTGRTIWFPHFSYGFSKEIDLNAVKPEIRTALKPEKVNFLFFGQIRKTKGILILQEAIDLLEKEHPEFEQNAHIVIAGMDKGKLIAERKQPTFVSTILRHISDSELNYIFQQKPTVLLPYTEIYQSGVLEVAIYFQCPSLMSDIPFFKKTIEKYPSFGTIYSPNSAKALAEVMLNTSIQREKTLFENKDILQYKEDHDCTKLCSFLTSE